jgi:hypothetical protein
LKPAIEQVTVGAGAAAWEAAGFEVHGGICNAGTVRIAFGEGTGIRGWLLNGFEGEDLDGLPTGPAAGGVEPEPGTHPNGTLQIDHLVVFTPDLERTTAALEAAGVERRRVREVEGDGGTLRQGFFRFGEVILEVVEHPKVEAGPARFWGITFTVADLDAAAELLGENLGSIRDAVQPGRRIATVRKEAGLGLPVALITPPSRK